MAVAKTTTNNKKFYAVEIKTFQHIAKALKNNTIKNKFLIVISSWQAQNDMIEYQSCQKLTGTLITEQWNTWIENSFTFISNKTNGSKRTKTVKGISYWAQLNKPELAKVNSVPGQTLYQRVWSWLRMNAGGVLNTCKSSEALRRISSDWSLCDWAADGWVTRG